MNKYVEVMSAGFGEDNCGYCLSPSMILLFTSNVSIAILYVFFPVLSTRSFLEAIPYEGTSTSKEQLTKSHLHLQPRVHSKAPPCNPSGMV